MKKKLVLNRWRGAFTYNGVFKGYYGTHDTADDGTLDYVIPEGVHTIEMCSSGDFRSLYIPDGVRIMDGGGTVYEMGNLISVRLPADLTEIPAYCLGRCKSLK